MEKRILTVGNVNAYIKQLMDKDFILKQVSVQGEVSNYKAHSSGHLYFTLKDQDSSISCVMFKTYASAMDFNIENGQKIIVQGSVSVYERSGQYQIYIKQIMVDGFGKLYQAFEALKKRLTIEGLFRDDIKQPIPAYAKHIGIITSDTGAAIKDIIQVSKRRNPYIHLSLYPALVQGPGSAQNIVDGIRYFNEKNEVDTIIVGRGGGSIEDLWSFNEEIVARAIYASKIPIISAVGHETDFTIADFVADFRAPTPSAAAEIAVYDYDQFQNLMLQYRISLKQAMSRQLESKKKNLQLLKLQIENLHPMKTYERQYQYIAELEDRLKLHMQHLLQKKHHQINLLSEKLKGLSPMGRLSEGYAYISDQKLNKITSVTQLKVKDEILLTLGDGTLEAIIQHISITNEGEV